MKRSRRKFLGLLAAGSAATLAAPAAALGQAASTRRRRPAAPKPAPDQLQEEIRRQQGYVATLLETVRKFELPAGSPPALTFRPQRASRPGETES